MADDLISAFDAAYDADPTEAAHFARADAELAEYLATLPQEDVQAQPAGVDLVSAFDQEYNRSVGTTPFPEGEVVGVDMLDPSATGEDTPIAAFDKAYHAEEAFAAEEEAVDRLHSTVERTLDYQLPSYRPEAGRLVTEAQRKFDVDVGKKDIPPEEPGFFDTIATMSAALPALAFAGRRGGASPMFDVEVAKEKGVYTAVEEHLKEEYRDKPLGTRMTGVDLTFAFLATTERLSAAMLGEISELTGESYGTAVIKALQLPQMDPSRPPRDYLWVEQERARRAGENPNSAEVFGRAITKSLLLDPLAWARAPTTVANKAKAVEDVADMAMRVAMRNPGMGDVGGIRGIARQIADESLATGDFFGGMLRIKSKLRDVDPALARAFDAHAWQIGHRGWRMSNPVLDVVELALKGTGAVARGVGAVGRVPYHAVQTFTAEGSAARHVGSVATVIPEAAGKALGWAGKAVGHPGRALDKARQPLREAADVIAWLGKAPKLNEKAIKAFHTRDSTPWGRMYATIEEMAMSRAETFPRGMKGTWLDGTTSFDAYAARMSYHHSMRALDDIIAHDTSRSLREISSVAEESSVMPHAHRRGLRLRDALMDSWNKAHRTWIDRTTYELLEDVKAGKVIRDERGAIQAIREAPHVRARELMDDGHLVPPDDAGALIEVIERRASIEARIAELKAMADEALEARSQRANMLRQKAAEMEVQLYKDMAAEGRLASEILHLERRINRVDDFMNLLGQHGLSPFRHKIVGEKVGEATAELRSKWNRGTLALKAQQGALYEIPDAVALADGRLIDEFMDVKVANSVGDAKVVAERQRLDWRRRHRDLVRRSKRQPTTEIISVDEPASMNNVPVLAKLLPKQWERIRRPAGMPKGRLYYRQSGGPVPLPKEELDSLIRARWAAARELGKVRTRLDVLADKVPLTEARAADTETMAARKLAEDLKRIEGWQERAGAVSEAQAAKFADMEFELRNDIRRSFSHAILMARKDATVIPELLFADNLLKVSLKHGVDLQSTYDNAYQHIHPAVINWFELQGAMSERLVALDRFLNHRYDKVLDTLQEVQGPEVVQRLEGYVHHHIRSKDRILLNYAEKRYVTGAKAAKHRKILTIQELKQGEYDPIEDSLSSLAAAEVAAITLKHNHDFVSKALGNRAWSLPLDELPKGIAHGGDFATMTHPSTGKRYAVDKEVAESLTRLIEATGDPEIRGKLGWFFDTVMVNPWKSWATYARPSFHWRNAWSNFYLMYAGGYSPIERPERLSEAIQIGSLRKLEELEGLVGETRAVLRKPREIPKARRPLEKPRELAERGAEFAGKPYRAAKDRMDENWNNKLREWAEKMYTLPDGTQLSGRQLYDEMAKHGVVNKRWQAADIDKGAGETLRLARRWDPTSFAWKVIPLSQESYILKFGSKIGLGVENHARSTLFLDRRLHYGDSAMEAARRVKLHLFDYKDLSKTSKQLRRVIPFWSWISKATKHELVNIWTHPNRFAVLGKTNRFVEASATAYWSEDEEAKRAIRQGTDWLRRRNGWLTWFSSPRDLPQVWDPNMPWQELNRFTWLVTMLNEGKWPALKEGGLGLLGNTVPVLKAPVSIGLDIKMPEGRPFVAEQEANWLTGRILDATGARLRLATTEEGKEVPVYDEAHIYMLENSFPHVAVSSKLFSDPKADPALEVKRKAAVAREIGSGLGWSESTTHLGDTKLPMLPGISLHELDPAATGRSEANRLARELQRMNRGARRYEPPEGPVERFRKK